MSIRTEDKIPMTTTAVKPVPTQTAWRMPWVPAIASVVILAGVMIFLYPHAASWFSQREQSRVTEMALEQYRQPPNSDPSFRAEELDRARGYNEALASGALLEAGANIPTGEGSTADDSFVYEDLLNTTNTGFMGRVQYDGLDIDLPIYHGTDDETLLKGVGHLEGTSLPVGGEGTRSVLTAHRGLPTATLFNELNRGEVGDVFTVSVLDEVLVYEVIDTQVVEPHETESVLAEPGRDLLTLVTCTPLGVNSHRILVTGERITPTPQGYEEQAAGDPEIPGFPWWAVGLGGSFLLVGGYIYSAGRPVPVPEAQPPRARHART